MTTTATADAPTPQTDEPATVETAIARSPAASIGFGLSPFNWEQGWRIAKMLAASTLVPKAYQGKPEDCIVALQMGAEIGLPPMASLQSIAVINGRPGLYSDGFLGVVMASPRYRQHIEFFVTNAGDVDSLTVADLQADTTRAICRFWVRGNPNPFTGEFSIADAKRAKLWTKEGPWTTFPGRMLKWRARGFAGRDAFAAELRGIKLSHELIDLDDDEPIEPTPIVRPMRRSERAATAPAAEPPAEPPPVERPQPTPVPRPTPTPTPTPTPPKQPAGPTAPTTTDTDALIVTDTKYLTPNDSEPVYEIRARVSKEGAAPVGYVFFTKDKTLYDLAASAEGTPQTFRVTWRPGKRADGSTCKVLENLIAS